MTPAELVAAEPEPDQGRVLARAAEEGEWRIALELADLSAGEYVEWHDLTGFYRGDRYQRGADQYRGDYRASVAIVELGLDNIQADELGVDLNILAPWGQDTTVLFGTDVTLDAGLLMRFGMFRVVDAATVEWEPLWTGRVEQWGDSAFARGQIRTHIVSVVDLLGDLANAPTIVDSETAYWDEWFEDEVLATANWLFGVDIYGDTTSAALPVDLNVVAAAARMDQGTDPLGLVWRTLRSGRLVIHPAPWDTTNTERYDNPLLAVYPDGLEFSYSPDVDEIEYIADDDQEPFGVQRNVAGVLNSLVITANEDVYPIDDAVSISRYGTRGLVATWILENHPAADDILADRAYATSQALPLRTSCDHQGFYPALAIVDHLDPVTVTHATHDAASTVTAAGVVRTLIEERSVRAVVDDVVSINWQSTLQLDLSAVTQVDALLPVEDLMFVESISPPAGGPTSAEFSWTNPTQPSVTPTELQYRVWGYSPVWVPVPYGGVGPDGIVVNWLTPETAYTFQVRLVRIVNGVTTHASPIREVDFTTAARIMPIPIPGDDPTDTNVDTDLPFGCEDPEIHLQENDGTGWETVDEFSGAEIVENEDGSYSLYDDIPNSFFNDGSIYRFLIICDGDVAVTGSEFDPPDNWTDPCVTPPSLADPPYDDADLIVYVPKICSPDLITEAVSGIAGVKASAYEGLAIITGDPNYRGLRAVTGAAWDASLGGMIAYGECPQIDGVTGDKTWACRVDIVDDSEDCVLWECAGCQIKQESTTGGWRAVAVVYKPGVTITLPSSSVLTEDSYYLAVTFDQATGDIKLYVDAVEDNTVGGVDGDPTINAIPIWRAGCSPGGWVTDGAVWDRVLDASELPGAGDALPFPPPLATHWWDMSDAANYTLVSGDYDAVADKIGSSDLGTPSGNIDQSTINGLTAADTVIGSNRFVTAFTTVSQPVAVVLVANLTSGVLFDSYDTSAFAGYVLTGTLSVDAGTGLDIMRQVSLAAPHVYWFEFNGASSRLFIDGLLAWTGNPGSNALVNGITLMNNRSANSPLTGQLGEVMVIEGVESDANRNNTIDTLLTKWGIERQAIGGSVVDAGGYRTHTMTASNDRFIPDGSMSVDYLIAGAGGGGGSGTGGGGSAGEALTGSTTISTAQTTTIGSGGGGGSGHPGGTRGGNGGSTTFGSIGTAAGGMGGGTNALTGQNGVNGSGGGAGQNGGTGSSGRNGGTGSGSSSAFGAGGGAGNGAAGGNGSGSAGGTGGAGVEWPASSGVFYGGGGGGGRFDNGAGGAGGSGGGGNGGSGNSSPTGGSAATGAGGGGNGGNSGSAAGSGAGGVIKVRYPIP